MPFTNQVRMFVEDLDEEAKEEFLRQILLRQNGVQQVETSRFHRTVLVAGKMLDLEAIRNSLERAGFSLVSMIRT